VPLDVETSDVEEIRIVSEEAKTVIAPLAEQLSDPAAGVIMIEMLGLRLAADAAAVVLSSSKGRHFVLRQLVALVEVVGRVRGAVAGSTPTAEPGRRAGVTGVVLVRHGLLTGGAPPKTLRDPRVVADLVPEGLAVIAIPAVVAFAVAFEAVERQPVGAGPVSPELIGRLLLPTPRAGFHLNYPM
jgi:hypothetical protein